MEVTEEDEEAAVQVDRLGVTPEAVVDMDVDVVTQLTLIHWRVFAAGCVAIWPVTVPRQHRHREVSMLGLPEEHFPDPGNQAQRIEEEVVGSASGALMSYTMRTGRHTPWTMQVSCTSLSIADRMPMAWYRLRRKKTNR